MGWYLGWYLGWYFRWAWNYSQRSTHDAVSKMPGPGARRTIENMSSSENPPAWALRRADFGDGGTRWREPRLGPPAALFVWVPVILSFVIQVPAAAFAATHHPAYGAAGPFMVLLALAGPVALIFARRIPGPVVAITAAAACADLVFTPGSGAPYVALAFAIVSAMARGARAWAFVSVGAGWVLALIGSVMLGVEWHPARIILTTIGIVLVLVIGESIRTRRDRVAAYQAAFRKRRDDVAQAERERIARELHDVLAHSLSQINVQAGVGLHLIDDHPEKAAEALASIKATSKTALDEVRGVLGFLRSEGSEGSVGSVGSVGSESVGSDSIGSESGPVHSTFDTTWGSTTRTGSRVRTGSGPSAGWGTSAGGGTGAGWGTSAGGGTGAGGATGAGAGGATGASTGAGAAHSTGTAPAPLVPQADLSRLPALIESISNGHLDVTLDNRLTSDPPPGVQLALYRITQESLTNVTRHAHATHARVTLDERADDYHLTVIDDGVGDPVHPLAALRAGDGIRQIMPGRVDAQAFARAGNGLLGMSERAQLLGGHLEAGPIASGGFAVVATVPRRPSR
ncbi:sensor histidine kinase [Subtercola sp. YIM 133946]|uniref:sensor histidine kinase n=1 Tax=Subtercola sp. YIM 133946 TaxID=3118909 RepID=UPI002F929D42